VVIQYLPYQQIDKQKWDACIEHADNGLIYGYCSYLDAMSLHWDALIWNDYEAVMPLTWNKKYGIHYLYQPWFTACLGIFGRNISAGIVNNFLHAVPPKFKFWDIYLNYRNYFELEDYKLYQRMNYVLPLNDGYENLYNRFRDNIKRNIKKASQLKCVVKRAIDIDEVIALAQEQAKKFSSVTDKDYKRFKKLFHYLHGLQKAVTYGVYAPGNQLVASCALFFSHNRAYYILAGNHPNGKTIGASHALINAFIKDHAGQNLLLDFEGSDIKSLAFFYSSFGAKEEKYAGLRLNRLPKILRLFAPLPPEGGSEALKPREYLL